MSNLYKIGVVRRMVGEDREAGRTTRLYLDAMHEGVELFGFVKETWRYAMPVDLNPDYPLNLDLEGQDGFYVDLAFAGATMRCFFPWACIWGIDRGGTTVIFEKDLPGALQEVRPKRVKPPKSRLGDTVVERGPFRLIKGGKA